MTVKSGSIVNYWSNHGEFKQAVVVSVGNQWGRKDLSSVIPDNHYDIHSLVPTTDLRDTGEVYDAKVEDPDMCGRQLGELCCKYLWPDGSRCSRFSGPWRNMTSEKQKGEPNRIFRPHCQRDIQEAAALATRIASQE
jgi:hypothetical protein